MAYASPTTIEETLDLRASGPSTIIAGGTDLYPASVGKPIRDNIIDISNVRDINSIEASESMWRLGAMTTWTQLLKADLPPAFNALKLAAREVGSVQIQNVATIVGNICNASPAADGVPPLLSLDASVELRSLRTTRVVPLSEFILGNRQTTLADDEMVTALLVPREGEDDVSYFSKLGARKYLVISIAMVAANLRIDRHGFINHAKLAVGACSAVAMRLKTLERSLVGLPREALSRAVMNDADSMSLTPIDDIRASKNYRHSAANVLITRTLDACFAQCAAGET